MHFMVALLSIGSLLIANIAVAQTATITPDALTQRGIDSYRAGKYVDAATDLEAAAQALLSQEQMQNYVNTGKFPNIDRFETALVYLTLAPAMRCSASSPQNGSTRRTRICRSRLTPRTSKRSQRASFPVRRSRATNSSPHSVEARRPRLCKRPRRLRRRLLQR